MPESCASAGARPLRTRRRPAFRRAPRGRSLDPARRPRSLPRRWRGHTARAAAPRVRRLKPRYRPAQPMRRSPEAQASVLPARHVNSRPGGAPSTRARPAPRREPPPGCGGTTSGALPAPVVQARLRIRSGTAVGDLIVPSRPASSSPGSGTAGTGTGSGSAAPSAAPAPSAVSGPASRASVSSGKRLDLAGLPVGNRDVVVVWMDFAKR